MTIAHKVDRLTELRDQIRELTNEADTLTTELKAFAIQNDSSVIAGYESFATLSFRSTGERLDRKILATHIADATLREWGALKPATTTPVLTTTSSRPSDHVSHAC